MKKAMATPFIFFIFLFSARKPKCRVTASIVCCSWKRTARCSGSGVRLPTNQWEEQVVEACAETVSKRTVAARSESIVAAVAVGAMSAIVFD